MTQAIAKATPINEVRHSIERMQPQFAAALPANISPEKFARVAMTAIQNAPDLLQCDRASLYSACMKSAQDGLLPDGREAALVKFGNAVAYMPMVGGVLKKIRNSGELVSLSAHLVCEADSFDYWIDDDGEHLKHRPNMLGDRGKTLAVYAIAKTKDGGVYVEVMTHQQVEQVRSVSRSGKSGPWVQWWDEMAKKTVIRRLAKRLPMSTDAADFISREGEIDHAEEREATPAASVQTGRRPSRLQQIVATQQAEPIDPPHTDEPPHDEPAYEMPDDHPDLQDDGDLI